MKRLLAATAVLATAAISRAESRPIRCLGRAPSLADGADLLFAVGGDNRPTGKRAPTPRVLSTIFSEVGLIRPDLVLWTGDAVYGYGDTAAELSAEYDRFEHAWRASGVALYDVPGNHEIHRRDKDPCGDRRSEEEFERRFGALYGSFDAGDVHFIALDTEVNCREDSIDGQQRAWLEADLEAHRDARAIFVFSHTEFFSSPLIEPKAGQDHPPLEDRDGLHGLFRRYPVRAVFSGHEHLYWHEAHDGIGYFVAGGGGAPFYASPDRGGFAHYLLVRVSGKEVAYTLIEPGKLFFEKAADGRWWVVNGNDQDIPLSGIEISAQAACAAIEVETQLTTLDGDPVPVASAVLSCTRSKGRSRVRIGMTVPKRTSVPILLRRRAGEAR